LVKDFKPFFTLLPRPLLWPEGKRREEEGEGNTPFNIMFTYCEREKKRK